MILVTNYTLNADLGKPLISEIRFVSQRYVFSILDLSLEVTKQLIIYLVYAISMCFFVNERYKLFLGC